MNTANTAASTEYDIAVIGEWIAEAERERNRLQRLSKPTQRTAAPITADPLLGNLGLHGGDTETLVPGASSPARGPWTSPSATAAARSTAGPGAIVCSIR